MSDLQGAETIVARIMQSVSNLRGIPHDFLWHTTDIDTGSAKPACLNDRNLSAVLNGALRTG
jgi:hypothetical protein